MSEWLKHYRENKNVVWIKGVLANNEEVFLSNFKDLPALANRLENEINFFEKLSLQFRSHEVHLNITDCDGIYLVKSILGQFGGSSKDTITFGRVIGNNVYKTLYISPELIIEKEHVDPLSNCFEEAIIYDKTRKNRKKQV
jgi:hypothetical protein